MAASDNQDQEYNLDLRKCKKIDIKTTDCVYGFVREMEEELRPRYIPGLVASACLLYYFENDDEWNLNPSFDTMNNNDNNTIIRNASRSGYGAFLSNIVKHGVHKWRFRINNLGSTGFNGNLGLVALHSKQDRTNKGKYDLSCSHGMCLENGRYFTLIRNQTPYAVSCKAGDIVKMTADLETGILKYEINDTDYGTMCTIDCNKEYIACAFLYSPHDSLTLL